MNLAEWVSQAQHRTSHNDLADPSGAELAVDFSLEKLSGFGGLLQHCRGLARLEATGNDLTSLAGTLVLCCSFHV